MQDGIAERWIETCRREILDHEIVSGERHLRRLLADYVAYDNTDPVRTRLGDSPDGRAAAASVQGTLVDAGCQWAAWSAGSSLYSA